MTAEDRETAEFLRRLAAEVERRYGPQRAEMLRAMAGAVDRLGAEGALARLGAPAPNPMPSPKRARERIEARRTDAD